MLIRVSRTVGVFAALSMMVGALWAWNDGRQWAGAAHRPDVTLWALRCSAVALGAAAQAVFITLFVTAVHRRDVVFRVIRMTAAAISAAALVSAVALGLAGR